MIIEEYKQLDETPKVMFVEEKKVISNIKKSA